MKSFPDKEKKKLKEFAEFKGVSGIYSWVARLVQYPPINKCDIPHKENEGEKLHDHINRCRKSI